MSDEIRVGLLFGGRSVEHEVSVVSARGVSAAMAHTNLVTVPLGVTGDGRWLSPELSREILDSGRARVDDLPEPTASRLAVVPGTGELLALDAQAGPRAIPIDVVFPLVHGWGGEDGRLQGALELAGIPVVGSGVLGSALAMDKDLAKQVLEQAGVPVVPWVTVDREAVLSDRDDLVAATLARFRLPVFVKPSNGGSSVGISKVSSADQMSAALRLAAEHDRKIVVEQGIDGREIECAVLGNETPRASGLGEIHPAGEFYDYSSKYEDAASRLDIPADLDNDLTEKIRSLALKGYRSLDLRGFARIDFLVERESHRVWFNEANTLPGFTPISMFPKLWETAGLVYPRLIEELVRLALEHAHSERALRTRR